jgi:acyl-coenzyme A thioesterase PaaI-like protein
MGKAPAVGESLRTRLFRAAMNLYPAYRGTGGRVVRISADWREVLVRLPLSWRTRNYVGTIFGGSIFAAVDPFYALMLMKNLGDGYEVWDKAASVRFRRPGRQTLYARFVLGEEEIEAVRAATVGGDPSDRRYTVELKTAAGEVCAVVEKVVYVRRKAPQGQREVG